MLNIIEIKDFEAKELDIYARLTENQLINRENPEEGMFIAESPKVIERALDAGYEAVSFLMEKKHVEGEGKYILERCEGIPVYVAEFEVLTKLTGFMLTRGMLCAMRRKPLPSVSDICKNARRVAVLEEVMNPTNVGAIVRSAAALNMDAVLFTKGCSNPLYRRAIRVSMGTIFQVPFTFIDDINELKDLGFKTVAMALKEDSYSMRDESIIMEEMLAIILGTEGDGLKTSTIDNADYTVMIPMSHGVDSLNVAAASAVAFFQLGQ